MVASTKSLFEALKTTNKKSAEFKDIQLKLMRVVRRNEDALCSKTENTKFSNLSTGLADKFTAEVMQYYPELYI